MVIAAGLVRVVWVSIGASVLVSVSFALAILGLVRSSEMRTARRGGAAAVYTMLALCALLCFGGGVIYGIVLLTQKG